MRWLSKDTVEFTEPEAQARDWFEAHLDAGRNIPNAAYRALNRMERMPSDEFIAYLSEDTCYRWGQRVLIRPEYRD
jgi:hypothetical protein